MQVPAGWTTTRGGDVISTDFVILYVKGLANVTKELTERQQMLIHNIQEPYVVNEVEGLLNLGSIQGSINYTLSVVRDGTNWNKFWIMPTITPRAFTYEDIPFRRSP